MCSSPCCTWNDYFHSWLRQVPEECEVRGMPVAVVGLDWNASSLGQGLCPGGCSYSTHCPWQLRDFCLAHVPPILSYLILLVTYTSPCAAAHSASHLSVGFCYKLNCWKVQQSGLKTSGKGERWVEAAAAALLSVEMSPSALWCLSPASCFEITQPSKWELKQFKLCRCVLTSAAALVFLLKLHFTLLSEWHQVAKYCIWELHCYVTLKPFSFFLLFVCLFGVLV